MNYRVTESKWLYRRVEIELEDSDLELVYSSLSVGSERIMVNRNVCEIVSDGAWYIPYFDIEVDGKHIEVEARVWPWISLRSLLVTVDGELVYSEGLKPYKVNKITEVLNAGLFYVIMVAAFVAIAMTGEVISNAFT
mgnify:CR=1 FL=1